MTHPTGARVIAMTPPDQPAAAEEMITRDPLGRGVCFAAADDGRLVVKGFAG